MASKELIASESGKLNLQLEEALQPKSEPQHLEPENFSLELNRDLPNDEVPFIETEDTQLLESILDNPDELREPREPESFQESVAMKIAREATRTDQIQREVQNLRNASESFNTNLGDSEVDDLAGQFNVPPQMVRENLREFQIKARVSNLEELRKLNPVLAESFNTPERVALLEGDAREFGQLIEQFKFRKRDLGYTEAFTSGVKTSVHTQGQSTNMIEAVGRAASGQTRESIEDSLWAAHQAYRKVRDNQNKLPDSFHEYNTKVSQEGAQFFEAWDSFKDELFSIGDSDRKELDTSRLTSLLGDIADTGNAVGKMSGELTDYFSALGDDGPSLLNKLSQSFISEGAPLVGGGVGAVAATSATGVGGTVGFAVGSAAARLHTEGGLEIIEYLRRRKLDIGNPEHIPLIAELLADPIKRKNLQETVDKAMIKRVAFGVASDVVIGKFLFKGMDKRINALKELRKTAPTVKEVGKAQAKLTGTIAGKAVVGKGLEGVGEGGEEFLAQQEQAESAKEEGITGELAEVDREAVLEETALGTIGSPVTAGVTAFSLARSAAVTGQNLFQIADSLYASIHSTLSESAAANRYFDLVFKMAKQTRDNKTIQANPNKVSEIVEEQGGSDTAVFNSGDVFTFWADREREGSEETVADRMMKIFPSLNEKNITQAVESDQSVEIPTHELLLNMKDLSDEDLSDFLKLARKSENGMNMKEAEQVGSAFRESVKTIVDITHAVMKKRRDLTRSRQGIERKISTQVKKGFRQANIPTEVVGAISKMLVSQVESMAQLKGITLEDYVARNPLMFANKRNYEASIKTLRKEEQADRDRRDREEQLPIDDLSDSDKARIDELVWEAIAKLGVEVQQNNNKLPSRVGDLGVVSRNLNTLLQINIKKDHGEEETSQLYKTVKAYVSSNLHDPKKKLLSDSRVDEYRVLKGLDPSSFKKEDRVPVEELYPIVQIEKKHRGFTQFFRDGRSIITILPGNEQVTAIHEVGHLVLNLMVVEAKDLKSRDINTLSPGEVILLDNIEALENFLEVEDLRDITPKTHRKEHELFAKTVEAYAQEGVAPSKELHSAFSTFKSVLNKAYLRFEDLLDSTKEVFPEGFDVRVTEDFREIMAINLTGYQLLETRNYNKKYDVTSVEEAVDDSDLSDEEKRQLKIELRTLHKQADDFLHNEMVRKIADQLKTRKTKGFRKDRELLTAKYTKKASNMRQYKLEDFLRSNVFKGKIYVPGKSNLYLNPEQVKALVKGRKRLTIPLTLRDGRGDPNASMIDVQEAADLFGYPNALVMLDELAINADKKGFIRLSVRHELNNKYPNFMSKDEKNKREAEAELEALDILRDEAINAEFKILAKIDPKIESIVKEILGDRFKDLQGIKKEAEDIVSATKVQDLKPQKLIKEATSARIKAIKTKAKGDLEASYIAKIEERRKHHIGRQAGIAVKEVASLKKFVTRKINIPKKQYNNKTLDTNLLLVAQAIAAQFGLSTDKVTGNVQDQLALVHDNNPTVFKNIAEYFEKTINTLPKDTHYTDLTVNDFRLLDDTLRTVRAIAIKPDTISLQATGEEINIQDAVSALREVMKKARQRKNPYNKIKNLLKGLSEENQQRWGFLARMASLPQLTRFMDGDTVQEGDFAKIITNNINHAQNRYVFFKEALINKFTEIVADHFLDVDDWKSTPTIVDLRSHFPDIEENFERINGVKADDNFLQVTRKDIIGMLLHMGNSSNKAKFLIGGGFSLIDDATGTIDEQGFNTFLSTMYEDGLFTKQHMIGVQKIWDLMESFKPEIQKAHRSTEGFFFKEVKAETFQAPWGEDFRGGYFPAFINSDYVDTDALKQDPNDSYDSTVDRMTFGGIFSGFTNERAPQFFKVLRADLQHIPSHLVASAKYAAFKKVHNDLSRVIRRLDFKEFPEIGAEFFGKGKLTKSNSSILHTLATQQTYKSGDTPFTRRWESVILKTKKVSILSTMTGNIYNTLESITEATGLASIGIEKDYILEAFQTLTSQGGFEEMSELHLERSRLLREQLKGRGRIDEGPTTQILKQAPDIVKLAKRENLPEAIRNIPVEQIPQTLGDVARWFDRHAFFLQDMVTNPLTMLIYHAAFNKKLTELNKLELKDNEAEARRFADRKIEEFFGAKDPASIPSLYRNSGAWQQVMMMYSRFFVNRTQGVLTAPDMASAFKMFTYSLYLPAVLSGIFSTALRGGAIEDEYGEISWGKTGFDLFLLNPVIFGFAGFVPYGRVSATVFLSLMKIAGLLPKGKHIHRPDLPFVNALTRGTKGIKDSTEYLFGEGDFPSASKISAMLQLMSMASGVPFPEKALSPVFALGEAKFNDKDLEGLEDYIKIMLTGRVPK